jgi:hypothetical protein
MATEFLLRAADEQPLGSFEQVQSLLLEIFPETKFNWSSSGPEKLKLAEQHGVEFPRELKKSLETLPAFYQGIYVKGQNCVHFVLGEAEPVTCLYVTPRGDADELDSALTRLEQKIGGEFEISGDTGHHH